MLAVGALGAAAWIGYATADEPAATQPADSPSAPASQPADADSPDTDRSQDVAQNTSDSSTSEDKITRTDEEWREQLSEEEYRILRKAGTERPGSSPLLKEHREGEFLCAACDNVLFETKDKFESGTGWPSFVRPADDTAVVEHTDRSGGMSRTEVVCSRCGGHLGHVFNDGPRDSTGLRYCINGGAMDFEPAAEASDE